MLSIVGFANLSFASKYLNTSALYCNLFTYLSVSRDNEFRPALGIEISYQRPRSMLNLSLQVQNSLPKWSFQKHKFNSFILLFQIHSVIPHIIYSLAWSLASWFSSSLNPKPLPRETVIFSSIKLPLSTKQCLS